MGGMTILETCDLLQEILMDEDMEDLPVLINTPHGNMALGEMGINVVIEDGIRVVVIG